MKSVNGEDSAGREVVVLEDAGCFGGRRSPRRQLVAGVTRERGIGMSGMG